MVKRFHLGTIADESNDYQGKINTSIEVINDETKSYRTRRINS